MSAMAENILFLTGHLARPRLEAVLQNMKAGFDWKVLDIGVKVAALMTEDIIARRLPKPVDADRVMLPGRCRADLERLSEKFGVPFVRGPEELKDIPQFFGRAAKAIDMTKYDIQIFAEIVDASALPVEAILKRAEEYCRKGANVIDIGCLPDTKFPHLEETVRALKQKGYKVSVDSFNTDELLRGGKAGADYLLSLKASTRTTSTLPIRSSPFPSSYPKSMVTWTRSIAPWMRSMRRGGLILLTRCSTQSILALPHRWNATPSSAGPGPRRKSSWAPAISPS
jgi:hypothetical protein